MQEMSIKKLPDYPHLFPGYFKSYYSQSISVQARQLVFSKGMVSNSSHGSFRTDFLKKKKHCSTSLHKMHLSTSLGSKAMICMKALSLDF